MKTWIIYLASLLMAFATTLLFGGSATTLTVYKTISSFALQIGSFIFIPLMFITVASGLASLRKDKLALRANRSSLIWLIITSFVIPIIGSYMIALFPCQFPVSSTAGSQSLQNSVLSVAANATINPISGNPFYTFAISGNFLLPIFVTALFLGYALKPNVDVIKPAYTVVNSFAEVMFRISHLFTTFGYILTYFLSTTFLLSLYNEKTIFVAPKFVLTVILITMFIVLVVLPLFYLIATRKNPYVLIFRTLAASISALSGANSSYTGPMIESLTRHNLGVQKRIASTATPLFALFGKAGSATLASIALSLIIYSVTGAMPTATVLLFIALSAALVSFIASPALGYELTFIVYLVMKLCDINLYGAEMTLIGIMPLFLGLGYVIDTEIAIMGVSIAGIKTQTSCPTLYKDII